MSNKSRIWIIDSDIRAYDLLTGRDVGLEAKVFPSFDAMLAALGVGTPAPHGLVLDERHLDAFIGIRHSSDEGSLANLPFVVVSHLGDLLTMERCFEAGATDYLCKPLNLDELTIKLRRHLARSRPMTISIKLNAPTTTALIDGVETVLTPREFQIMELLHKSPDRSMPRQELHGHVWNTVKVCNKVLDVHVSKLRKKLAPLGLQIRFVKPNLYRLEVERRMDSEERPPLIIASELRRLAL